MSGRAGALCGWVLVAALATAGCGAPDAPAALEGVPPVDLSNTESPVVDAIEAASRDVQRLPDSAIVWCEGMADWLPIGEVGDLLGGGDG